MNPNRIEEVSGHERLPPVFVSDKTPSELSEYFDELRPLSPQITLKRRSETIETPEEISHYGALEALLRREACGAQLRYVWKSGFFIDTVLVSDERYRIVRIELDSHGIPRPEDEPLDEEPPSTRRSGAAPAKTTDGDFLSR